MCFTHEMDVELAREQSAVSGQSNTPSPQKGSTPTCLEPYGLLPSPAEGDSCR